MRRWRARRAPYPGDVTSKPRTLVLAALGALALALAACTATTAPDASTPAPSGSTSPDNGLLSLSTEGACDGDEGVTLIVDTGSLDDADAAGTWCVIADDTIGAADALLFAGVTTEGTTEYPDQIVCRVDGVPAEATDLVATDGTVVNETCESMPPAHAYWSLWIKPAAGEWGYAEEGLSTLKLEPGDSIELLFQLNGEPAAPTT